MSQVIPKDFDEIHPFLKKNILFFYFFCRTSWNESEHHQSSKLGSKRRAFFGNLFFSLTACGRIRRIRGRSWKKNWFNVSLHCRQRLDFFSVLLSEDRKLERYSGEPWNILPWVYRFALGFFFLHYRILSASRKSQAWFIFWSIKQSHRQSVEFFLFGRLLFRFYRLNSSKVKW